MQLQEIGQNEIPCIPLRAHVTALTHSLVEWVPYFPVDVLLCLFGLHDTLLKDEVLRL